MSRTGLIVVLRPSPSKQQVKNCDLLPFCRSQNFFKAEKLEPFVLIKMLSSLEFTKMTSTLDTYKNKKII